MESSILHELAEKAIDRKELYRRVEQDFGLLPEVLGGVSSSKARIRYGCASVLMDLSEKYPEKLYSQRDFFVSLLDSEYRILTWNALAIIANLSSVDLNKKFDTIIDKYYSYLYDPFMVTVANVVVNSAKIVLSKPYLATRITNELLKVEDLRTTPHLTEECKKVIAEKTIDAFDVFFNKLGADEKAKAISFAKRQIDSSRKTLRLKAELFLRKWDSQLKK